ncbi:hypothetical protein [Campylobacter showae]|nr:MAG TPA: hypothetical protein [Bacteriophage sp.]
MAKTITKLPDAPSVERPGSFNQDADKFVRALGKFTDEANALALAVETAAKTVQDAAFSAQPILDAKDEALRAISAATTQLAAAQNIKADAEKSAQKAQSAAQAIEAAKNSLASASSTLEEMKKIVSNGFIDDAAISESRTYSSKKIEDTFQKKGAQTDTYAKSEINSLLGGKVDLTAYAADKATFVLKPQLGAYVTTAQLNNCVTQGTLNKYTKAQNITSNTIDFMQGVNFTGSVSGQITAGDREAGQSGLVYISGGVSGFSSDFVILNQAEATYGQGYVFFSYFVRPGDNKVLISFIKAA